MRSKSDGQVGRCQPIWIYLGETSHTLRASPKEWVRWQLASAASTSNACTLGVPGVGRSLRGGLVELQVLTHPHVWTF